MNAAAYEDIEEAHQVLVDIKQMHYSELPYLRQERIDSGIRQMAEWLGACPNCGSMDDFVLQAKATIVWSNYTMHNGQRIFSGSPEIEDDDYTELHCNNCGSSYGDSEMSFRLER